VISWLADAVSVTADELFDNRGEHRRSFDYGSARTSCEHWLREFLNDGPMPQQQIQKEAEQQGFGWMTVRRAKDAIRGQSFKAYLGGGWFWQLPTEDAHSPIHKTMSTFEE